MKWVKKSLGRRKFTFVEVCDSGHEMTETNTYVNNGRTFCRICRMEQQARYRPRRREVIAARKQNRESQLPRRRSRLR